MTYQDRKEIVARDKGEHSYYKQKRYSAPKSRSDYSMMEEWQRVWKSAEELLKGYRVLQGHGVMTLGLCWAKGKESLGSTSAWALIPM